MAECMICTDAVLAPTEGTMLFKCKSKPCSSEQLCCAECHQNWLVQMKCDQSVLCPICKKPSKLTRTNTPESHFKPATGQYFAKLSSREESARAAECARHAELAFRKGDVGKELLEEASLRQSELDLQRQALDPEYLARQEEEERQTLAFIRESGLLDDQAQAFAQVEQKRKDEALARQLASEGEPERPASPARRPRQSGRLAEPKGGAALPSPSAAASEAGQALPRAPASKSAVPQDARQGGGRGEGSGPRDGADSSEGGQQDLESHVSPLSTPSSSPGRAAGGSADTHSAVRGAGGVDVGDDGPSASGQHSASSNPDVALAHGAQGAKGEVDAEVGARAFGAGGLAFDIPPELLADVDTQAFLHEQRKAEEEIEARRKQEEKDRQLALMWSDSDAPHRAPKRRKSAHGTSPDGA